MTEHASTQDAAAPESQPETKAGAKVQEPVDVAEALGNLDAVEQTDTAEPLKDVPAVDPAPKSDPEDTAKAEDDGATEAVEPEPDADAEEPKAEDSARVQKRMNKLTARFHEAEERAETLQAKVAELEAAASQSVGVHPMFLTADEAKAIRSVNELEAEAETLFTRLDGYDDEKHPEQSMTAEEVRKKYVRTMREVNALKPRAMAAYERAMAEQVEALKLGHEALKARKSSPPGPKSVPASAPKKPSPPNLPVAPKVAPASATTVKRDGPNKERFEKAGRSQEALAAELSMI